MDATLLTKIHKALESDKIYRQSNLNLYEFARHLQLPQRKVSDLINQHFGMGFPTLIQKYRLEDVLNKISKCPKGLILEKIAYESGFSSRITFFKIFKKAMGMSPTEYTQKQLTSAKTQNSELKRN